MDLKKYAPLILSITASAGVIATAILSHKATEKAMEDPENEDNWKHYIPTAVVATGTVTCIIGAHILNQKQQVALANAYTMLYQSFDQYKKKVIEHHGIEEHHRILDEIRTERAKDVFVTSEYFMDQANNFYDESEEPKLFYDVSSKRYFEARPSAVLQAEYFINRNYILGWNTTLLDWYEFLGIEPIENADKMYFNIEDGLAWIDFDHHKMIMDDGLECWVIDIFAEYGSPQDG